MFRLSWCKSGAGLERCSQLQQLDISGNALTCLKPLSGCRLLLDLNAASNLLPGFPQDLSGVLLHTLSLQGNRCHFIVFPL